MVAEPLERSVLSYTHHGFVVLDGDTDAASAVKQMHGKKAEIIIVRQQQQGDGDDDGGRFVGIVTDTDILDKVVGRGDDSDRVLLRDIMSSPVITISAKANARQALELMRLNAIKRIPVTDNVSILGIVSREGLAHAIQASVLEKKFRPYRAIIREHYKPIWGNLGFILQFAGVLIVAPGLLAAALGEAVSATGIFLGVTFMFLTGFALNVYGEKTPLNLRQASILMVSSFVLLSFFGSIPYMYVNPFYKGIDPLSLFVNSFFESASGFTTTGLSMIVHPENLPNSFDFYRSFTQWIGGLSFVYLIITFFYPERKLAHMKGMIGGGILRLKQLLLTISVIFSVYTLTLSLLLYLSGSTNTIYNVSLVLSTVTGGGFLPASTSLASENTVQLVTLMAGMVISALPFAFHYAVFSREMKTSRMRPEIYAYLGMMFGSILVFYFFVATTDTAPRLMTSAFHVLSAMTTSGFQFADIPMLSAEGKMMLITLMLIGGTAFSTAGGIKVGRILQIAQRVTRRKFTADTSTRSISSASSRYSSSSFNPYEPKAEKLEEEKTFNEALMVIALFVAVSFATAAVLWHVEQRDFLDSLFESVSALTTTGITAGITSMDMGLVSKAFLVLNMIAGRFEIIAIVYLFLEISRRRKK